MERVPMLPRSLVVVGASAGGVEALLQLVRTLPADLPAPVCVVLHQPPRDYSFLPSVLGRAGPLSAVLASDGELIQAGTIYVAAPDAHLIIQDGHLRLMQTARVNGHRPAIDPLFRSAARAFGPAAVGVVLSGADDDGTEGLLMIKARGGAALVQDPKEALFPRMPESAAANVAVDAVLPVAALAGAIERAVTLTVKGDEVSAMEQELNPERDREQMEQRIAAWEDGQPEDSASGYSCPLCGGIWVGEEGPLMRFHCHTGHEFSQESFVQEQAMVLETTLWYAVRALNERVGLLRRLSRQQAPAAAPRLAEEANDLERGVELLRQLLQGNRSQPAGDENA
jgi:two-component system chemotaxis response regulator CheB